MWVCRIVHMHARKNLLFRGIDLLNLVVKPRGDGLQVVGIQVVPVDEVARNHVHVVSLVHADLLNLSCQRSAHQLRKARNITAARESTPMTSFHCPHSLRSS
jgi:hypothetical protein